MVGKNDSTEASYIKSLIEIAQSDGFVDEQEVVFLTKVAERFKLSATEIKEIKKHHRKVNFIPPTDFSDRVALLYDIVNMMIVDGNINENEVQLCHKYAQLLEFKDEKINKLIETINCDLAKGYCRERTLNKIMERRLAF